MSVTRRTPSIVTVAIMMLMAMAASHCGGSSTGPTTSAAISAVTLSATSAPAGTTVQGTVTLGAAAPAGGAAIALASSNPAVATVQTPVTVAAGSSSAAITVSTLGIGSTTITASINGSSKQSALTVTSRVTLVSLSLSTSSVVGGTAVNATVALNAAAPNGGAVVALSAGDPLVVPQSVTVPAGAASATFSISTKPVGAPVSVTVNGNYGGASASALLRVTQSPVATASFGVSGPSETDTCTLTDGGNTLDCTFNGGTSSAPGAITAWDWSYGVAKTFAQTTRGPQLTNPTVDCSVIPPPPLPAGTSWFTMTVTLTIHDNRGNVSPEAVNSGVRLLPQGVCGF
jgi:hypothetical protein